MNRPRIAIAGGGAAGFFAAIACAERNPAAEVTLFEATAHVLAKVRVSGGGRCNVTHACFDPRELVKRYPRGGRELLGAFHRWQPRDTIAWFAARGVELKTEADGRMFPVTDDSRTIVECLLHGAEKAGVKIQSRVGVGSVAFSEQASARFNLGLTSGENFAADRLLLATGGNQGSAGLKIASQLGHSIEPPVPSLFTFHIDDPRLKELAGLSVEDVETSVGESKLRERGPLLITHWGLSGPAVLKLSAWGARELQVRQYRFDVRVNWLAGLSLEAARSKLTEARQVYPRKHVATWNPVGLPQRLWERLVDAAGITPSVVWASLSNEAAQRLALQLTASQFSVSGKSMNKEEFVTCGGVKLSEVDFKTMESRRCAGLFFAGEVLDIDGITGGFNFQAAWTTGFLAGQAMAS
jgi:hypothetical protein